MTARLVRGLCSVPLHGHDDAPVHAGPVSDAPVRESVQEVLAFRWTVLIRPRMEGLTDAEYLWEPAPGTLTVRPGEDGTFTLDPVRGGEIPLGNIAWRMAHTAYSLAAHPVAAVAFGEDWPRLALAAPAGTAADALDRLDRAYERWQGTVGRLSDDDLQRKLGPAAGEYASNTWLDIVLHVTAEALQGGADLCLFRDLYAHREGERSSRGAR